jgi:hypothetical protein
MYCTEDSQSLKGKTFLLMLIPKGNVRSCLNSRETVPSHFCRQNSRSSSLSIVGGTVTTVSWIQKELRIVQYLESMNTLLFPRVILCNLVSVTEMSGKYYASTVGAQHRGYTNNKQQTPWSESASELYRPSDRRLSAK